MSLCHQDTFVDMITFRPSRRSKKSALGLLRSFSLLEETLSNRPAPKPQSIAHTNLGASQSIPNLHSHLLCVCPVTFERKWTECGAFFGTFAKVQKGYIVRDGESKFTSSASEALPVRVAFWMADRYDELASESSTVCSFFHQGVEGGWTTTGPL